MEIANPKMLPVEGVVPFERLQRDDDEDTRLLKDMARMADRYLRTFPWCREVSDGYFGVGVGGIIAVFLFRVVMQAEGKSSDEWLWVFVGDVPAAYTLLCQSDTPYWALKKYVESLAEWVRGADCGETSPNRLPIECPRTPQAIAMLKDRLDTLTNSILPNLAGS
jgi:hypothetical protein